MKKRWNQIEVFLIVAFTLPLISVLLQTVTFNSFFRFALYGLEAASPSIAGLIVLHRDKKVKEFFIQCFGVKKLILALTLPVAIVSATMLLAKSISCLILDVPLKSSVISVKQFIIILWSLLAEEIGWRGYLQPSLKKLIKREYLTPLFVGVIWGLWHYHYFLTGGIQVPLIWFFVSCIVESYIYNYLLICTENNLLSAIIYHFSGNLFIHLFAINPIDNMGKTLPYITFVFFEILSLFIIFLVSKFISKN